MAFMVAEGQADIAISEDSDLIAYGCPNVIMKLNLRACTYILLVNQPAGANAPLLGKH